MKNFTMKITDVNSTWSVVLREIDADPTDSVNIRIVENELATSTGKWCVSSSGCIFSSPEPSGSQGELIVYPYSGVRCRRCRQQCLNIFSSETALPIKAKFYVEPPWKGGTKIYINGPGHMTKMAAMPIYGKNL